MRSRSAGARAFSDAPERQVRGERPLLSRKAQRRQRLFDAAGERRKSVGVAADADPDDA